jgi:PAS domain-containing protein
MLIVTAFGLSGNGAKAVRNRNARQEVRRRIPLVPESRLPLFDGIGNILGWYGNDTDIHDRKQAEEKLRQDEMELRRITDAIPQAITLLGPEGNALYANGVALEIQWPYSRERQRRRFSHPGLPSR